MSQAESRTEDGRSFWRLALILAAIAALFIPWSASHSVDFPVYYRTAQVFLAGHGPIYGPQSGLGYPLYYRYPPLFLFAFVPFGVLPFKISVALWAALKWVALFSIICALARRLDFPRTGPWWLVPALLSSPFLIEEFAGGNAQFLIFALTATALLLLRRHPGVAAFLLALATCFKVWPFFFIPYLAARRRYGVAAASVAFILVLTLVPAVHFGWHGNASLLRQWAWQEWGTDSISPDALYPSQSLWGVLQRYLTVMDYSKMVDSNYRNVTLVALAPHVVRRIWAGLVVLGYSGLLLVAYARPESDGLLEDSLAWCGVLLLEPITSRLALTAFVWSGMVAGALLSRPKVLSVRSKFLFYASVAVTFLAPLVPGGRIQRLLQVLGIDFWATFLLTAAVLAAWFDVRGPRVAARSRVPSSLALSLPPLAPEE